MQRALTPPRPRHRERAARRALEVVPPLLVWLTITSPAWGAVVAPTALGYFLILFSAYWLYRSVVFAAGVVVGYVRLELAQRRDWRLAASRLPGSGRVHHVVLIPTCGESEEILADTLHHLVLQDTPLDRVSVILAFEERDAGAPARARHLVARFGTLFARLLVTFHPDLPGEVRGKSSNLAWAARRVEEELIRPGSLAPEDVLVTICDADSRLHPRFLSALSHEVLSRPDGRHHVYQPAMLFYANHWRLSAPLRAMNSVYSLYALARMVTSHRLVTQSTYCLAWTTLQQVGYWDVDVIPEDSRMFFKVFFHFGRRVKVHPIYLPVYADAAEGPTLWRTLVNHYQQIRRWAWGVSDVPYVVLGAARARQIPLHTRAARALWYVEEHLIWPIHWFILTLGGLLPPLINPAYAQSPLGLWQARLSASLLSFGLPCLLVVLLVDWRLRPNHPDGEDALDVLVGWAGYLLLPVVSFALSTIPALDAHTRLLFGRYLEYRVTEKVPVRARFRERMRLGAQIGGLAPGVPLEPRPFEHAHQHRAQPLGSPAPVADALLHVVRDIG